MDRLKKGRTPLRTQLTRLSNQIQPLVDAEDKDEKALKTKLEILETVWSALSEADSKIKTQLLDDNANDDDIQAEFEVMEQYQETYCSLKHDITKILELSEPSAPSEAYQSARSEKKRQYKLPKIELMKFDGDLKNWLPWWSQYKKIHEDDDLDDSDKFQYLSQSIVAGTEAKEIVSSYPLSAENYDKAVEALKERFGRDDLQLQYYVRQLLTLVISNVTSKEKLSLSSLYLKLESHLRCLATLKMDEADPATWLYPLVESSLAEETLRAWQRSPLSKEDSTDDKTRLDFLMDFIRMEVRTEQQITLAQNAFQSANIEKKGKQHASTAKKFGNEEVATAAGLISAQISCAFCDGKHMSDRCVRAQSLTYPEKCEKIKVKKLCYRCLQPGHISKKCKVVVKCVVCSKPHFPIMCQGSNGRNEKQDEQTSTAQYQPQAVSYDTNRDANYIPSYYSASIPSSATIPKTSSAGNQCSGDVVLNTLKVKIVGSQSTLVVRIVGDTGSQRSYIRRDLVKRMGCPKIGEELIQNVLFGNFVTPPTLHHKYHVTLCSLNESKGDMFDFLERDEICGNLPQIPDGPWIVELRSEGIQLSDVGNRCETIDILIGSDEWGKILTGNIYKLNCGLVAIETIFGWTVSGKIPKVTSTFAVPVTALLCATTDLTQLWSLEAIGIRDSIEAQSQEEEEEKALQHFQETVERNKDGSYCIALPWKSSEVIPPTNRNVAERRLQRATQQLLNRGQFGEYDKVFCNWEKEGFITKVEEEEILGHYLPHRPVYKESATTPVRPVFDASCKIGSHPSLNDCLYKGPNLLELIPTLLLRFREQRVGVSSDIRKAFQMVHVRKEDQIYQKFLWWEDYSCQKLKVYQHQRVVFGMNCSPFLLAATINSHLQSIPDRQFADKLAASYYVDNCITSVSCLTEYEEFKGKAIGVMAEAGMELREWAHSLEHPERDLKFEVNCDTQKNIFVNVLGMRWDRVRDSLSILLPEIDCNVSVTKRQILSLVAHVFDPIGFTSPALIPLKILIQQTWVERLSWDEELPEEIRKRFLNWIKSVNLLAEIWIPRHCQLSKWTSCEIHVFVDASGHAYAGAVYMRTQTECDVKIQLLLAKSRLAPSIGKKRKSTSESPKNPTIPRLELMACVVGTRLAITVKKALKIEKIPFVYWSDSTTALAWIKRHDHWGTFVGNRVQEILRSTSPLQWRHVPGNMNPADFPSRGCNPPELLQSRWWEGPNWLYQEHSSWPRSKENVDEEIVNIEKRKCAALSLTQSVESPPFSSYRKNLAVWAWVLRYLSLKFDWPQKKSTVSRSSYVTIVEMRAAEKIVLRQVQRQMFADKSKRIGGMMVITDDQGLLRVKTRLTNRRDTDDFLFPIILPKNHPIVDLLILDVHKYHGHAGTQFIIAKMREKYWILQSRRTIQRVLKKCTICRRHQSKPLEVVPAPLPFRRVSSQEPFETTGVDLGGPLFLKDGSKCWFVVFTCAYYRCMYLDLVCSLSTEAFLGALERFMSLYGRPNTVYSDNGTNFHGCANVFRELDWKKIEAESNVRQITWIFNPPTAAWWGGWWERMVRSIKDLLKRMLGKSRLSYDELRTCLAGVCRTINDRPLTVVTEDGEDLIPLTPSMFMRIRVEGGMPETADAAALRRGYVKMKSLQQHLEHRFRKEYLSLLVQRGKEKGAPEIAVGNVVLVGADNKKRFAWPLGIVQKLLPGKDGETRAAEIKTSHGVLLRPIQRLYPLEFSTSEDFFSKSEVKVSKAKSRVTRKEDSFVGVTKRGRVVQQPVRYGQWLHLVI